jgi:ABC-2 type transport system permease protein
MATIYRFQLRLLRTRGRMLGLGALGLIAILLGLVVRGTGYGIERRAFGMVGLVGLGGLVPITSLVLASASLGDLAEDATLVHLWLRPVKRFHIAVASWLAALTFTVPLAVIPMSIAAAITGVGGRFVVGTFVACLLGSLAYTALFVGLGLRISRALAWGLAYVLVWEGAIANAGAGLSKLAVRLYTRSLLRTMTPGTPRMRFPVGAIAAVIVPLVVTGVALALTTRRLHNTDIA